MVVDLADRVADWDAFTPCPEWTARALAGHLVDGARTVASMLTGQGTFAPIAAADELARLAGSYPAASLRSAADSLANALHGLADEARLTTPHGEMVLPQLLSTALIEPVVHGWDLSVATGEPLDVDDDVVAGLLSGAQALGEALAATGMYAAARRAPAGANPIDRLIASLGRARPFNQ